MSRKSQLATRKSPTANWRPESDNLGLATGDFGLATR